MLKDLGTESFDREVFNSVVYLSLKESINELEKRQSDIRLTEYVRQSLPKGLPEVMRDHKNLVLFRHLATSNYEIKRFAMVADSFPGYKPILFEYLEDSFNDVNEYKHHLGKLRFHKGFNKHGSALTERVSVVDFTKSNTKPLTSLVTFWGELLVDFHHRLFNASLPQLAGCNFDLSTWLREVGPDAKRYYKPFLTLFLQNGILFENFLPYGKELSFTQEVILPAILEIQEESGAKPLIVALEPTEIEGDHFWLSHPHESKRFLKGTVQSST